jgi:hypothetical protein
VFQGEAVDFERVKVVSHSSRYDGSQYDRHRRGSDASASQPQSPERCRDRSLFDSARYGPGDRSATNVRNTWSCISSIFDLLHRIAVSFCVAYDPILRPP